jgi:hypothetical protein|tara:strand:+ start:29699 stop:30076 length:378 start_codon:yes stop_codon:yes gene_type:complete
VFYPKIIYENLPYLCCLISAYLLAFYDTWMVYTSAGIFYSVGCLMLVQRSNYRRVDRYKDNPNCQQTLPVLVYEYLPYLYVATAMMLLLKTELAILQFLALCLMIIALRNLLFRSNNRRKAKSLF